MLKCVHWPRAASGSPAARRRSNMFEFRRSPLMKLWYHYSLYFRASCFWTMDDKRSVESMREIIISEIQTRPSLWDDTHPQYKNVERNKKMWEEIGKSLGKNRYYWLKQVFYQVSTIITYIMVGDQNIIYKTYYLKLIKK